MPSPQYLIAHACFGCRKSFKVAPRPDFLATCPNCGEQLREMGRSFKAPPVKDTEQWARSKLYTTQASASIAIAA